MFLKWKNEMLQHFKEYKLMVERQTCKILKMLWSDNGGEYTSNVFNQFCKKNWIML